MHKRFSEEFKKSAIIRVQNGESQLSVASKPWNQLQNTESLGH